LTVAAFVGVADDELVWTRNATEGLNLVAAGLSSPDCELMLRPGDEVVVTEMEHHANLLPWQRACARTGATLRWIPVTDQGRLDLDAADAIIGPRTKVLAMVHASNVLGTINPVAEIAARARAAGVLTVVDGAQGVPQCPVDIPLLGVDFYAWTGHKALGPTGVGVLHGRAEILTEMRPWLGGGHMIARVERESSTWTELPWKFEAGTDAIAEAIGLGAAVDYLAGVGMDRVRAHECELTARALDGLRGIEGVNLVGPPSAEDRGGVVSFEVEGMHPHDVADLLNRDNVCVRAGHHCAKPLMRRLGVAATARASLYVYNDEADVDALADALDSTADLFLTP